uniref:LRRCT domain-containing protein n=1 Tax=Branchiostoma floridae TaxID=7739 RepID=C3ZF08_BRAFL|eukprot:XP_002593303.1 hypothetical protein BRAFLDRAFT_83850 [Branchiostoma floridae]
MYLARCGRKSAGLMFFLLLSAGYGASDGPAIPCMTVEWQACVTFEDVLGNLINVNLGTCVLCKGFNADFSKGSPPLLTKVSRSTHLAIRGHAFGVLSAEKLASLDHSVVKTLALVDAFITDIENDTLKDFTNLVRLGLVFNTFTHVRQGWLSGLANLQYLILSNNQIQQIEPGSFVHLSNLRVLDLGNNKLQVVDNAWLRGLKRLLYLFLGSNKIQAISPTAFQYVQPYRLDLSGNDLSCLDGEVFRGHVNLGILHIGGNKLVSVHDAMSHPVIWNLGIYTEFSFTNNFAIIVKVPKLLSCIMYDQATYELVVGWTFDPSIVAPNVIQEEMPGASCTPVSWWKSHNIRKISVRPPVVIIATDSSAAAEQVPDMSEQCRQVWKQDVGITVVLGSDASFRLLSMSTGRNATKRAVAMVLNVPIQNARTPSTKIPKHTSNTSTTYEKAENITCILIRKPGYTKLNLNISNVPVLPPTTVTTDDDEVSRIRNYTMFPFLQLRNQSTVQVRTKLPALPYTRYKMRPFSEPKDWSTLPGSSKLSSDGVLIPVISAAAALLLLALAAFMWRVCSAKQRKAALTASNDAHIWTIPPGIAFPGLFRSASLPSFAHKAASEDTASCTSLPTVLYSIEPTYSEIPDSVAAEQSLSDLPHTYSVIPDLDGEPMSFYAAAAEVLPIIYNGQNQHLAYLHNGAAISKRHQSGQHIAAYGEHRQTKAQCGMVYRCVDNDKDRDLGNPPMPSNIYWPLNIPRRRIYSMPRQKGTSNTPQRASLPLVTLPNTYWPWEIPEKGTHKTPRRASLPLVIPPNTYWPWEIPEKGTHNTPRRASLPLVIPPNTYWPWKIPEKGPATPHFICPPFKLPNTYSPWKISEKGNRNTPRRASLPLVIPPNTYWPWKIPEKKTRNTPLYMPPSKLPNTYSPWKISEKGNRNTPRRASLPHVTLPNTYWPWKIPERGTHNTPLNTPPSKLPNTYWPWEIPEKGTCNTPRHTFLPPVTPPNTYWPWEIPEKGTRTSPWFLSSATLPNTYWPWEISGEGTQNTP